LSLVNLLIGEMRVSIDQIVHDHRDHRSSCRQVQNRDRFPSRSSLMMKLPLLRIRRMLAAAV